MIQIKGTQRKSPVFYTFHYVFPTVTITLIIDIRSFGQWFCSILASMKNKDRVKDTLTCTPEDSLLDHDIQFFPTPKLPHCKNLSKCKLVISCNIIGFMKMKMKR